MSIYSKVPMPKPNKSLFDLSYSKCGTGEVGQEIAILCDEVVSGDVWKASSDTLMRLMPLVKPILTDLNVAINYFFIPYRLLDEKFEDIFTGGEDGSANFNALPKIHPKFFKSGKVDELDGETSSGQSVTANSKCFGLGGLWDCLGYPCVTGDNSTGKQWLTNCLNLVSTGTQLRMDCFYTSPVAYNIMAYYTVINEWFLDENIDDFKYDFEFDEDSNTGTRFLKSVYKKYRDGSKKYTNMCLVQSRWTKDYFVSALPFAQRGTAPALPISGMLPVGFADVGVLGQKGWTVTGPVGPTGVLTASQSTDLEQYLVDDSGSVASENVHSNGIVSQSTVSGEHPLAVADLSSAITFDISDLRLAFSIQKWQERNAISGGRFHEVLLSHFGTAPADDALDRPLYLGGVYNPMLINSVIQTSESGTTVQGNETGRGVSAFRNFAFKYHVKEPGIVLGLMSLKPKAHYSSQGFNRQWLKNNRYDFFFPEFANIGEQEVLSMELVADGRVSVDTSIFGFQGRYDEMRSKQNIQTGLMRGDSSFNRWSCSRAFSSVPTLSTPFIEISKHFCDDNKAVPDEPLFMYEVHNNIKALRPLPKYPIPGGL